MSKFPGPIDLPNAFYQDRRKRITNLVQSAKWGVVIRFSIILFELVGVIFFGSYALMMDAVASLIDIVSSLFLILFIKLAERPPDDNHPFGHGRFEPLAGFLLGLMLALIGLWMGIQQAFLFSESFDETINPYLWIIPFCACILLEICYQRVHFTAKKENSPALAAEAIHYRIDGATSLFATIALIFAAYFPEFAGLFDGFGAVSISVLMIVLGVIAAKKNLHQVLDSPPDSQYFTRVREASKRVEGVLDTEKLRIQLYGPDAHVDIDIEVDPTLSVDVAHKISQQVRAEIQKEWPAVRDVTVHIEPYYANDH